MMLKYMYILYSVVCRGALLQKCPYNQSVHLMLAEVKVWTVTTPPAVLSGSPLYCATCSLLTSRSA